MNADRRQTVSHLVHAVAVFAVLLFCTPAFADMQSTNYKMADAAFTSGGGNAQSSSYKVAESFLGSSGSGSLSSTNYSLQAASGISGVDRIAAIQSLSPSDYARFFSDQSASYTVTASSPDGDSLQYRAKQDGTTKVSAQSSSSLSWSLSSADLGKHSHSFDVIDPQGTVTKTQSAYVYRRPLK